MPSPAGARAASGGPAPPVAGGFPGAATTSRLPALLLFLVAAFVVLVATSRYGPGLTPDSANYYSAAASLRAGDGLLDAAGERLVHFPPLLPALLAALGAVGLAPGAALLLANLVSLAIVLRVTVALVVRLTGNPRAALVAGTFTALSAPHLEVFTQALSEALFVGVLACFAWAFATLPVDDGAGGGARHDDAGNAGAVPDDAGNRPEGAAPGDAGNGPENAVRARFPVALVGLALIAATIPLARYVGVVVLPAAALALLLVSRAPWWRRAVHAALFTAVGAAPLALYLARNVAMSGDLAGERTAATASALSVLRGFVVALADWVVPWSWLMRLQGLSDAPWALALFFATAVGVAAACAWMLLGLWSARRDDLGARRTIAFLVLWVAGYAAFLCLSALIVSFNPIGPRFLTPLFFPAVVLVAAAATEALYGRGNVPHGASHGRDPAPPTVQWRRGAAPPSSALRTAALVLLVPIGALQIGRVAAMVVEKRAEGAGGYATRAWQEAPFFVWVRAHPPPVGTMSNGPDALYLVTGERYAWVPWSGRASDGRAVRDAVARGATVTVAWFDAIDWRPYLMERDRLVDLARLDVVHREDDGALYASGVDRP